MLSTVLHTVARHALLTRGERVLVAVSGGPDSMALLAVLWELAPRLGLSLEVATVDHGLRREAAAERELVAERAQALGLPCHHVDVAVKPGGARGGVQQAARDARLAALTALGASRGCARVALGHQADDQAETILFRIIRGTGPKGLVGIPYRRDPFVRPLLDVTRARILAYLRRRSLPFVMDPSNADPRFSRARLRHTILPLLRKENPRVDEALRGLADAIGAGADSDRSRAVAVGEEAGLHVSARLAAELAAAAARGGTRSFDVSGGRRLTVSYGHVTVEERAGAAARRRGEPAPGSGEPAPGSGEPAPDRSPMALTISEPGVYTLGPRTKVVLRAGDDELPAASDWACFDRERLAWPLTVRVRRPGDRMHLRGGRGSRKLSDLLIDAKVARHERAFLPVVADAEGELLYVPGLRPSKIAAPGAATRRWIALGIALGPNPAAAPGDR